MDVNKILAELRAEREKIERTIIAFEGAGGRRRRGRKPKWMKAALEPIRIKATNDKRRKLASARSKPASSTQPTQ
jgi:hypothetical protein